MIKLNFNDGTTLEFDLNKEEDLNQWLEWSAVKDFQDRITGIGILHEKRFFTLTLPRGFKRIRFSAELVYKEIKNEKKRLGERLICHVDAFQLSILVYTYNNPPPPIQSRTDLRRIGKQRGPYQILKG